MYIGEVINDMQNKTIYAQSIEKRNSVLLIDIREDYDAVIVVKTSYTEVNLIELNILFLRVDLSVHVMDKVPLFLYILHILNNFFKKICYTSNSLS